MKGGCECPDSSPHIFRHEDDDGWSVGDDGRAYCAVGPWRRSVQAAERDIAELTLLRKVAEFAQDIAGKEALEGNYKCIPRDRIQALRDLLAALLKETP